MDCCVCHQVIAGRVWYDIDRPYCYNCYWSDPPKEEGYPHYDHKEE